MVSSSVDLVFKILLLGDSSVGKTCFLLRYIDDTYTENHISTIGVDYKVKMISHEDQVIKLQVWDTAGQDRFRSITKNYFRGSNGIMLIYDITNQGSFQNIKNWIWQIKDSLANDASVTLVGNKCDLESARKIQKAEGQKLAEEYGFHFFETSAKENINIFETFHDLTMEMMKKGIQVTRNAEGSVYISGKNKQPNKKKCCEKS
jgi:small GTP-binding protein